MKIIPILGLLAFQAFNSSLSYAQDMSFTRAYGGTDYEDSRAIVESDDGGFVITGLNKGNGDVDGDTYLMKINAAGAMVWQKFFGLPLEDGGNALIKCADGGYLISGHMDHGNDICDGYLIKTDKNGNKLWSVLTGGPLDDLSEGLIEWADGSFYLTGRYENDITGDDDLMLTTFLQMEWFFLICRFQFLVTKLD